MNNKSAGSMFVGRTRMSPRHQPQQSVLKPHCVQRQTACMRYISAPQRSQRIGSSFGAVTFSGEIGRSGGGGADGSAIARHYRTGSKPL